MKNTFERAKDQEADLPRWLYFGESYFQEKVLFSLSNQLLEIHSTGCENILEIGKGNGFVSEFLKISGKKVTTLDVNESLKPDIVAGVEDLEKYFKENQFDCILCAEVLEHLPFGNFSSSLKHILWATSQFAVISLPINLPRYNLLSGSYEMKLPKLKSFRGSINLSLPWLKRKIYSGHHWEINSEKNTDIHSIREKINEFFFIKKDYQFYHNRYHRFFVLEKK